MQKVIGSIIVLLASTAIGFMKAGEFQEHVIELERLKHIFALLKKEIEYTRETIPELLSKICEKTEGIHKEWLKNLAQNLHDCEQGTFEKIWRNSVEKSFDGSRLTKVEKDELCQVGKNLGYIEFIDLYLEQLDISIRRTREEMQSKKKLFQSLGVLGGIFLVIMLL